VLQANAHPTVGFIGCEPFVNGMAKMLSVIDRDRLKIYAFMIPMRSICLKNYPMRRLVGSISCTPTLGQSAVKTNAVLFPMKH